MLRKMHELKEAIALRHSKIGQWILSVDSGYDFDLGPENLTNCKCYQQGGSQLPIYVDDLCIDHWHMGASIQVHLMWNQINKESPQKTYFNSFLESWSFVI